MAAVIFDTLNDMLTEIAQAQPQSAEEIEQFRIKYLGTKNIIKPLMGEIRNVPNEDKPKFGQLINKVKQTAEEKYEQLKAVLEGTNDQFDADLLDTSAPGEPIPSGARHPVSIMLNKIIGIFERIGFTVAEEREVETDWYNFTAMNTPEDHPARDMQDTFYVRNAPNMLLRPHTSSV